ncbi:MAG: hypothetical protein JWL89_205 [Candidatus Saccharibacteria bacterium]|nr:hypothetical protein [Candidatus Saccharibacteria bacterium]
MTNKHAGGYSPIAVLFALIIIVAVGLIGFRVFGNAESKVPVGTIFNNLQMASKQKFSDTLFVGKVSWPAENGTGMPLKAGGYPFKVSTENMPSLQFVGVETSSPEESPECAVQAELRPASCPDPNADTTSPSPEAMHPIIAAEMKKDGFKQQKAYSYKDTEDNGGYTATIEPYVSKSRGCVYADRLDVRFSCYDKAAIQQAAAKLSPFVTQYEQQYRPTATVYYGPSLIKGSQIAGYSKAEIIVVDGNIRRVAFFYDKDNGPWKYVARTDDELGLSCKELQIKPDVRAAFHGQICQSNNGAIRLDSTQPQ